MNIVDCLRRWWRRLSPFVWYRDDEYGTDCDYEPLIALLTLAIVTGASYALAINQISNSFGLASFFYSALSLAVLLLIGVLTNATVATSSGSPVLRFDRSTVWFGRGVAAVTILLAAAFIFAADSGWFPGQQPARYEFPQGRRLAMAAPVLASNKATITPEEGDQESKHASEIDNLKNWFGLGFTPMVKSGDRNVLIVEQDAGFAENYNTCSFVMRFRSRVKYVDALVVLKRAGRGNLEFLTLPTNQAGETYPVVEVENPNRDDRLIFFVMFEKDKVDLDANPEWYKFHVLRSNDR